MIYLTHHYHLPRSTVTALAIIVGIGALAGIYAGARLSDRLLGRGWISARIVVPGAALLSAAILFAPAIWTTNVILGIVLLTCGTAALAAANPPIDAARLDVVPSGCGVAVNRAAWRYAVRWKAARPFYSASCRMYSAAMQTASN